MEAVFEHNRIILITDDIDFGEPCKTERVISIGTARRLAEELTYAAAASQPSNPADSEKVTTESVTQPKIDFCHACGTALGCR